MENSTRRCVRSLWTWNISPARSYRPIATHFRNYRKEALVRGRVGTSYRRYASLGRDNTPNATGIQGCLKFKDCGGRRKNVEHSCCCCWIKRTPGSPCPHALTSNYDYTRTRTGRAGRKNCITASATLEAAYETYASQRTPRYAAVSRTPPASEGTECQSCYRGTSYDSCPEYRSAPNVPPMHQDETNPSGTPPSRSVRTCSSAA